jgi:hypothetical protein
LPIRRTFARDARFVADNGGKGFEFETMIRMAGLILIRKFRRIELMHLRGLRFGIISAAQKACPAFGFPPKLTSAI